MIGDAIAAALPTMRAHAESLMVDTCTIERAVSTWGEGDQKTVTTWAPIHENIPCHLTGTGGPRAMMTGETVTPETPVVKLPYTVDGIKPDDRVTIARTPEVVAWVSSDDTDTHPVERVLRCRWTR